MRRWAPGNVSHACVCAFDFDKIGFLFKNGAQDFFAAGLQMYGNCSSFRALSEYAIVFAIGT